MIPSYMFNTLTISGKRHELEAFRESMGGLDPTVPFEIEKYNILCFNRLIKLPKARTMTALQETRKEHWGTASDALGVKLKEKDHKLVYTFITFDTVPKKIIEEMLKQFPELSFQLQFKNDRKGIEGAMRVHKGKALYAQTDKFHKEKAS